MWESLSKDLFERLFYHLLGKLTLSESTYGSGISAAPRVLVILTHRGRWFMWLLIADHFLINSHYASSTSNVCDKRFSLSTAILLLLLHIQLFLLFCNFQVECICEPLKLLHTDMILNQSTYSLFRGHRVACWAINWADWGQLLSSFWCTHNFLFFLKACRR